jgi:hypothetical protein
MSSTKDLDQDGRSSRSPRDASGTARTPLRFADAAGGARPHICAFFHSAEEQYDVILPFVTEGFERGDKAFHVVDPKLRGEHLRRLEAAGIEVEEASRTGQLELADWESAYLRDGSFDQDRMLAMWEEVLEGARESGFPLTRLFAKMEWALEEREGVDDLLEYEARFNLIHRGQDLVICAYDVGRFNGDIVVDLIRTHPMILIGGIVQENPFYIPPEEFVRELRGRAARRDVAHG